MATLVFGAVGTALGGPVGGFIGAAVGSAIDNFVVMPLLFGEQDVGNVGQDTRDIRVTTANEGGGFPLSMGPLVPVKGTIVYAQRQLEKEIIETSQDAGGKGGGGGSVTVEKTVYRGTFAHAFGAAIPNGFIERIFFGDKVVYRRNQPEVDSRMDAIEIGDGTQVSANSIIVAGKAADNVTTPTVPMKGTVIVAYERCLLTDWNNILPQATAWISSEGCNGLEVREAFTRMLVKAGMQTTQIDMTRVPGCLRGFLQAGPVNGVSTAKVFHVGYNIAAQDQGEKIVFRTRGDFDSVVVPSTEIVVPSIGSGSGYPARVSKDNRRELPERVMVSHIDPGQKLSSAVSHYDRVSGAIQGSVERLNLPFVLAKGEARTIARREVQRIFIERQKLTVILPPRYITLLEGDEVVVPIDTESYTVRITRVTRSPGGLVELEGNITDADVFNDTGNADDYDDFDDDAYVPTPARAAAVMAPALNPGQELTAGFLAGCQRETGIGTFAGALLYTSPTENGTYTQRGPLLSELKIGRINAVIPQFIPEIGVWDGENTIDVKMFGDATPTTGTEAEALAGTSNLISINGILVSYRTATDQGSGVWRLSDLLWGRRGTNGLIPRLGLIISGDTEVVWVDRVATRPFVESASNRGSTLWVKAVPVGETIDNAVAYPYVYQPRNVAPVAPTGVHRMWNVDADGDYVNGLRRFNFMPRSRQVGTDFMGGRPVRYETRFKLQVFDENTSPGTWVDVMTKDVSTLDDAFFVVDESVNPDDNGHFSSDEVPWRIIPYSDTWGYDGPYVEFIA